MSMIIFDERRLEAAVERSLAEEQATERAVDEELERELFMFRRPLPPRGSFVTAAPEMMTSAATDLATIGSTLSAAKSAAAAPTTGILAAAEDEVSAAIAAVFSAHGQGFQAFGAQAAAFHDQFVQGLTAGAGSYVSAEAANVAAFTAAP